MLKIKYFIYKAGEEYTSIMDSKYIYNSLYEVADALFYIESERINCLISCIIQYIEGDKIKAQIREAINSYISRLEKIMIDYFNQKAFCQIPIEEIPDYNYLDNLCVHKFVIDNGEYEYEEDNDCEENDEYDKREKNNEYNENDEDVKYEN